MDESKRQQQINELWDAYVLSIPNMDVLSRAKDRAIQSIEMLRALKLDYEDAIEAAPVSEDVETDDWTEVDAAEAEGFTSAAHIARHARVVWQLMSLEFSEMLLNPLGLDIDLMDPGQWRGGEREALQALLKLSELPIPHTSRASFDPLPCVVPRWLFNKLKNALAALDEGEVQAIVAPARAGRHDDAWTWDQMRSGVLEHMYFLFGQDKPISRARQIVAEATGISVETIRAWEKVPKLTADCQLAVDAGELKAAIDIDPNHKNTSGKLMNHRVLARLQVFEDRPLSIFGRQYREQFGHRHNQSPSGGNGDQLPPLD